MEFDWMSNDLPEHIVARNAERAVAMAERDVYLRAALLRRLGYDASYTKHRLLGNQRWAFEVQPGGPRISEDAVKKQVDQAYKR
jgi:hypothetical protein